MAISIETTKTKRSIVSALSRVALGFMFFSVTVHAEMPIPAHLAQCTIDSYGETGRQFLKENNSKTDRDRAYRNWMVLCMEAKGFKYSVQKCPLPKNGAFRTSEGGCYEKM